MNYPVNPSVLLEYARLYYNWYWVVVILFTVFAIIYTNKNNKQFNLIYPLVSGTIIILFITFRPPVVKYFGDTANYLTSFEHYYDRPPDFEAKDIGHEWLQAHTQPFGHFVFFFAYALIYVGAQFLTVKKIFPQYAAVAFIIIIASYSFFGYSFNGMRNGAACALVMYGIVNSTWIIKILLFAVGWSFHSSVLLPIGVYFLVFLYRKTNLYLTLWLLSLIVNAFVPKILGHMDWLEDFIGEDKRLDYFENSFEDTGTTFSSMGFRWDFVLYSAVPIFLGWYTIIRNRISDFYYSLFFNLYVVTNTAWLFTIWIPYTNRFAYLSWFVYPIILFYPFILNPNLRNNRAINLLLAGNLLFTLIF